jgi:hypothetical protein
MKYLSDYQAHAQSELLKTTGAFFAFSGDQLGDQLRDGVKYTALAGNLFVPRANAKALIYGLKEIRVKAIQQDLKENGRKAIIHRELGNYECQITNDITEARDVLEDYGITEKDILNEYREFFQNCIDNDYF